MIFFIGLLYLVPMLAGAILGNIQGVRAAHAQTQTASMFWRGLLKCFAAVFVFATCITWVFFNGHVEANWETARYFLAILIYSAVLSWIIFAVVFWIGRGAANALQ